MIRRWRCTSPGDLNSTQTPAWERVIAKNKNQNTFAKRQREQEKKRKAEDKRARRQRRKDGPGEEVGAGHETDAPPPDAFG